MAIGAEEAYGMFYQRPQADLALEQLNRNTERKLGTQRWLAEENAQNERDKWRNVTDAVKTGIDSYDKAKERGYRADRDTVMDQRENARMGMERDREARAAKRDELETERARKLMDDEERARQWDMGTEEGQTMSRGDLKRKAELESTLQRPKLEKAQVDAANAGLGLTRSQIKMAEENARLAKEDRKLTEAAERYQAAFKRGDQKALAQLDADYANDLGAAGVERAKLKAQSNIATAQTMKDMEVRSTAVGGQAIQEIAAANAEATQLNQTVNDALDYIKATPGSAEAENAKGKVLASLPESDKEYVRKGGGIGLAGYNVDTSGFSKPQDRMVQTLQKIRADLEKRVNMLETQYGQLPSSEVQNGIASMKQTIKKIDVGLSGQKRNSVQLIGGGAAGPQNADFFRGRAPNPQGQALGPIPVGGMGGGVPSMRDSQINRQLPATGAVKQ